MHHRIERNVLSLQSICGSSIVTGISYWPLQAAHTLLGIWRGYGGTDEGFHSHGPPRGVFSLFACLCRFKPNHNPPKRSQASEILNPKRDLLHSLCLLSSLGVEEAIHWNSIFFFCPLKSQYGVRKPLPVHSCHALLLSRSPPLDMHDVCLLINLCSKNGTEGNVRGQQEVKKLMT